MATDTDLAVLKEDWNRFKRACSELVDTQAFHAINNVLGFNLAKACGPLLLEVERLDKQVAFYSGALSKRTEELRELTEQYGALDKQLKNLEKRLTPAEDKKRP